MDDISKVVNSQAADLAIMRLLLAAALRQLPDQPLLLQNFREMAEDHAVRTMYSGMPESFFQALQTHREAWETILADVIESTGDGQQ